MLKSTIWAILCEQFFCAPFGFGALGLAKRTESLWRSIQRGGGCLISPLEQVNKITLRLLILSALKDESFYRQAAC